MDDMDDFTIYVDDENEAKQSSHELNNGLVDSHCSESSLGDIKVSSNMVILGHELTNDDCVNWEVTANSNPHLIILGTSGSGKTYLVYQQCIQLVNMGITPIIFSYHPDIDTKLCEVPGANIQYVDFAELGLNPLEVYSDSPLAHIDNASFLRDMFASIFPDLGDIQLGKLRKLILRSYAEKGWDNNLGRGSETPEFRSFYNILKSDEKDKASKGLLARLDELNDYGFFSSNSSKPLTLLNVSKPSIIIIRLHRTQNEVMQKAFAFFILHHLYIHMFLRGVQENISHVVFFEEGHKISKLKLLSKMIKECRKFGIAIVLSSTSALDFDEGFYSTVGNFLAMRLNASDAIKIAKIVTTTDNINYISDRIKGMQKKTALFYGVNMNDAVLLKLRS